MLAKPASGLWTARSYVWSRYQAKGVIYYAGDTAHGFFEGFLVSLTV